MFSFPELDLLLRLALAMAFGAMIGFERRWRGHAAGPHTNGLVALGAALLVVAGVEIGGDGAARVAAQVATGVGFLAGGVILRDGFRVRGLNTAATIWYVAGIGVLTGYGRLGLAAAVTLLVVIGNAIFHLMEHGIAGQRHVSDRDDDGPQNVSGP